MSSKHVKELFNPEDTWHESVRAKLDGYLDTPQFHNFSKCGKEQLFRTCKDCGDWSALSYRCSVKWCPRCNWMITRKRAALLRAWTKRIRQPKHVVLTQKNFPLLTRGKLREHQKNLARLRKQKVFANVQGGCVSVEVTNKGEGWHLHSHWFVDARWIDASELAVAWGKLCGQEFGIVKVQDARAKDYEREVAKYVVKGNELATWCSDEILQFVTAVRGVRFFFTFGSLSKLRSEIKQEIEFTKPDPFKCKCGCGAFRYEDEASEICNSLRKRGR
jgi:hypothetical protein